uniref:ATP synthase subunit a n=1 Tax=Magnusiomyces tetraspermus TaxID=1232584 RepID=A0A023UM96_9ASCO|nr:ATP synthase F0 subunit a [Magnusiomyces tetraspermus]AHY04924.1 ATP synthase F0 subunit a [Magnusiomyces tetraspermus]
MFINSPLEQFEINTYISTTSSIADFSWTSTTNFGVYTIIVFSIIIGTHTTSIGNNGIIPTKWSMGIESTYSTTQNMVYSQIGISGQQYFPTIYVIFVFITISNTFSMIPYNFATMSHTVFTVSTSSITWTGVTITGFYNFKTEYFGTFVPAGTTTPTVPVTVIIETTSYTARSVSTGTRTGSNITAGHTTTVITGGTIFDFMSSGIIFFIVGFTPTGTVTGIMCTEFAIGTIQAYVFSITACSYIKEAIYTH